MLLFKQKAFCPRRGQKINYEKIPKGVAICSRIGYIISVGRE